MAKLVVIYDVRKKGRRQGPLTAYQADCLEARKYGYGYLEMDAFLVNRAEIEAQASQEV